eukprot:4746729-Lingulodinium_polyedra.AAC.1
MALDVLPSDAKHFLEDFESEMLRETVDYLELLEHGPVVEPYMDPVLGRNRSVYADFIRELRKRFLVQWTLEPQEFCGLFFVKKKGDKQRMIVDARRSNMRFKPPPGVALASPESFARLEAEDAPSL